MSDKEIALAACESVYETCTTGSCASFNYYYNSYDTHCSCGKSVGAYEFIYENYGYYGVGQDYGGAYDDVSGNTLFVRVKASSGCNSNSWNLALADLGTPIGIFVNKIANTFQVVRMNLFIF